MSKVESSAYIEIEEALTLLLQARASKLISAWLKKINAKVKAGDFAAAEALIDDLSFKNVVKDNRKKITLLTYAAFAFGSDRISSTTRSDPSKEPKIEAAIKGLGAMVIRTEHWVQKAVRAALEAEKKRAGEVVQKAVTEPFVSFAEGAAERAAFSNLQLASSLHSSRTASFGFLTEARLLDMEFYQINAVLDGRTSDICMELNGKRFPVAPAYDFISRVLEMDDIEDIKAAAPWPSGADAVRGLSSSELMDAGWGLPPYHPYCRTHADVVTEQVDVTPQDVTPPSERDGVDILTALGIGAMVERTAVASSVSGAILSTVGSEAAFATMVPYTAEELFTLKNAIARGLSDSEIMTLLNVTFSTLQDMKDYVT